MSRVNMRIDVSHEGKLSALSVVNGKRLANYFKGVLEGEGFSLAVLREWCERVIDKGMLSYRTEEGPGGTLFLQTKSGKPGDVITFDVWYSQEKSDGR
ncbi:hypothetical protein LCGC14_1648720 [marine sediment metagenome]|uniref:Uncharacterized protein n=1 Tax=marine sediment metagenome TaxID=412755 RepID=A0A0F9HXF3_9ZZZZ